MKLFKNILKVVIAYAICMLFAYVLVLRVKQVNERDSRILQEYNYEEYYVYENK